MTKNLLKTKLIIFFTINHQKLSDLCPTKTPQPLRIIGLEIDAILRGGFSIDDKNTKVIAYSISW